MPDLDKSAIVTTDRSRILAGQRCPRERWIGYHACGKGIQRRAKGLPLQFGSAFHEGVGCLLLTRDIEGAVGAARGWLLKQFAESTVELERDPGGDADKSAEYGKSEQMALAEALVRAWWRFEGEDFLRQFEIVEVEREGRAVLAGGDSPIHLMLRPDALLKDRESGDFYVLSWKTAATFNMRTIEQARHDMQSISECWGIENDGLHPDVKKVEGVLYRWIVKGRRAQDRYDGLYKQQTHLIYGWMKEGASAEETDWSWAYEFEREDGSGSTRLGKGWRKVPIWTAYPGGVAAWIDDLANRRIGPRHVDPLNAVFPQALPVDRNRHDVECWKRQTTARELAIAADVRLMQATPDDNELLDVLFPQFTHSCEAYSGCSFRDICWGNVPIAPGELYQIREANHPEEDSDD